MHPESGCQNLIMIGTPPNKERTVLSLAGLKKPTLVSIRFLFASPFLGLSLNLIEGLI